MNFKKTASLFAAVVFAVSAFAITANAATISYFVPQSNMETGNSTTGSVLHNDGEYVLTTKVNKNKTDTPSA